MYRFKDKIIELEKRMDAISNTTHSVASEIKIFMEYMQDKDKKQELAQNLYPHYAALVQTLKRSKVFLSGDEVKEILAQVNEHLTGIRESFAGYDKVIQEHETRIKKLEEIHGGRRNKRKA